MKNTHSRVIPLQKVIWVGLLIGFLLNLTGWLGNNFILGSMWDEVGTTLTPVAWRASIWSDVFSLVPDFIYGLAIAWLIVKLQGTHESSLTVAVSAGLFISLVGGITTYFAIANSGFVPWNLALASFGLVLATKLPLAILAGALLLRNPAPKQESAANG